MDVSRKDYREIADALRELRDEIQASPTPVPMDWKRIANWFASALKKDNPRFSAQKFWDYIER